MLRCPHCEHCIWSTDSWAKHIHTHHASFPTFVEMKLECLMPKDSQKVLAALAASQVPPDIPTAEYLLHSLIVYPFLIKTDFIILTTCLQ